MDTNNGHGLIFKLVMGLLALLGVYSVVKVVKAVKKINAAKTTVDKEALVAAVKADIKKDYDVISKKVDEVLTKLNKKEEVKS